MPTCEYFPVEAVRTNVLGADALVKAGDPHAAQAESIALTFTRQARRRMARNVRGVEKNEDAEFDALAAFALERGAYPWDVI